MEPGHGKGWETVLRAVREGDDAGDGLLPQHLEKAEQISVADDGSGTFVVERHPNIFGRASRGLESEAFIRRIVTYRFAPERGLAIDTFVDVETIINHDLLAERLTDDFLENIAIEDDLPELASALNENDAERIADEYASTIPWIPTECHDSLDEKTRRELCVACRDVFREKVLDWWRDNSPHVGPET